MSNHRLDQVHCTAGAFVLQALCLVYAAVNFALSDSDSVPTSLFWSGRAGETHDEWGKPNGSNAALYDGKQARARALLRSCSWRSPGKNSSRCMLKTQIDCSYAAKSAFRSGWILSNRYSASGSRVVVETLYLTGRMEAHTVSASDEAVEPNNRSLASEAPCRLSSLA